MRMKLITPCAVCVSSTFAGTLQCVPTTFAGPTGAEHRCVHVVQSVRCCCLTTVRVFLENKRERWNKEPSCLSTIFQTWIFLCAPTGCSHFFSFLFPCSSIKSSHSLSCAGALFEQLSSYLAMSGVMGRVVAQITGAAFPSLH